jgi:hypothetical protein
MTAAQGEEVQEYLDRLDAHPPAEPADSFDARFHVREVAETKRDLEQICIKIKRLEQFTFRCSWSPADKRSGGSGCGHRHAGPSIVKNCQSSLGRTGS